jgi:putative DNA primase/helicase
MHNDGLLILDELSQVSSKDIGSIVYMLGNEQGKKRMTSDINIRRSKAWRMSGLSSGEIGIADKIEAEKGAKARAGQLVRCLDIDAQVSEEYGIYTNLHGFHSGAELSNYLKEATSKCYGTAAEEFVKRLLELPNPEGTIRSAFEDMKKNITERFQLEEGVSGQVQRIADAFALYAAVGTLASSDYLGVFTHNAAGIEEGVFATFESWLKDRGGKTSVDEERVCDAMVDFLAQNDHRFYKSQLEEKADQEIGQGAPVMIERINLPLGYKESEKEKTRYYIYPNLLKKEFYSENGFGVKTARKILAKQGLLATDHKGNDPVKHKDGLKQRLTTIEIPCISQESANQMKEWKKDNIP